MTTVWFFPAFSCKRFLIALTASLGPSSCSLIRSQISMLSAQFSSDNEASVARSIRPHGYVKQTDFFTHITSLITQQVAYQLIVQ